MAKKPQSKRAARHKIFVVEDHPVFREGLIRLINDEPDLEVCGSADNAKQALREIKRLAPDLALVDLSLPGKNGLELIKELRATARKPKLLVVSMHDEAIYADRVLRAGGDGYIMKEEDPDEIVDAIRDVLAGHMYVSEEVLAGGAGGTAPRPHELKSSPLDNLTDVELEILELLGRGRSNEEIARQLRITTKAVDSACQGMPRKLNLKHGNELIRFAVCWIEKGAA
jgi:DNA-binding NarL/FixJ family response regulator